MFWGERDGEMEKKKLTLIVLKVAFVIRNSASFLLAQGLYSYSDN